MCQKCHNRPDAVAAGLWAYQLRVWEPRVSTFWEESLAMGGTRDPPTLPLAPPSRGELPSTLADGAGATEGLLLTFKKSTKRGKNLF